MNYIAGLNPEQRKAVEFIDSPSLIFAGAGSGKTKVLTHKIAYLIEKKIVAPKNILAVTFTNKAAKELRSRVENFIGKKVHSLNIGTFHSICAKILRSEISHLKYSRHFTIYDEKDQLLLLKRVINEHSIILEGVQPKSILSKISLLKNKMIESEDFKPRDWVLVDKQVKILYPLYQKNLKKAEAVDFDDLLILPLKIFEKFPEILQKYRKRFQYILVDEYQDTNRPQFLLIFKLGSEHKNVCVVGDDDQSIYGWRGADVENILKFDSVFPNCKTFKLEQNYRSTNNILKAASSVVSNNISRADKNLWSEKKDGDLLVKIVADSEYDEAARIASHIRYEILHSKRNFKDFTILYRTNAQSRVLEEILRRNNIVYIIVGGVKFYERKEVKDILAYLHIFSNPKDDISLIRIINTPPRGIGKSTQNVLDRFAKSKNMSIFETLAYIDFLDLGTRATNAVKNFYQLIQHSQDLRKAVSFEEWSRVIVDELGIRRHYKEIGGEEARQRLANVDELLNDISDFCENTEKPTLEAYLEIVSLSTDIDVWEDQKNAVSLMTLHSAKGLEFPVVFICGLNQGLLPLQRDLSEKHEDEKQIEEERRLFYVGMTRAKEKVFLSTALRRGIAGEMRCLPESIFIKEIPEDLIKSSHFLEGVISSKRARRKIKRTLDIGKREVTQGVTQTRKPKPGLLVSHKIFGLGKILEIDGAGKNAKLKIYFKDFGKKTIIARFVQVSG